ncbi:MAG TPA: hypothetical protein DCY88_12585 [Cyanobacteria bacterium UBA11372]|nr:hypothetical protein [Cyanobacteria bacterium UBA11372]
MATYSEVLIQVKSLTPDEQLRLLEDLAALIRQQIVSEKQGLLEVVSDPLVGLFAGSPDLATKSEEILQQTSKEMPKRNLNRWYGFLPKRVDALEFQLKLRQEWDD